MEDLLKLDNLELSIDKDDELSLDNGNNAIGVYVKFQNTSQKKESVSIESSTYITFLKEQVESNSYLRGYANGDFNIRKEAYVVSVSLFYKSRVLLSIPGDLFEIVFTLKNEGKKITAVFQKCSTKWVLNDSTVEDVEVKLTSKQIAKKLVKKIERIDAFEDKFGILIDNTSINVDDNSIDIFLEISATKDNKIKKSFYLKCIYYDNDNSIIDIDQKYVDKDDFFAFSTIKISKYGIDSANISKIRIYPSNQ